MPQVRVRYPLVGDRIVPYLLGGGGIALTDFNDRKAPAFGVAVRDESSAVVGTLGAGVDFFLSDNVAFNTEVKYLFAESQTLRVGGVPHRMDVSTPLTSVGLRVFVPEGRPPAESPLLDPSLRRLYFNARIGLAEPFDTELGSGIAIRPVPPAIGGELAQYFGLAFGLDLTRYLGVEMGAEGYEVALAVRDVGAVTEYAVYGFTPRLRLRYPVGEGRWVPYGIVGLGLAYAESNDRKPHGAPFNIRASDAALLATAGLGFDYFVASNIALGLETKYLYSPGHHVTIAPGHSTNATLQALAVSFGVRIYLWNFRL
jgi:opacity protein-like surface antigen